MEQQAEKTKSHYIHRITYSLREQLVGGFLLLTVLMLIPLVIFNSGTAHLFEKNVPYHAHFKSAQGITTDTVVQISGLEVGRVATIEVTENNTIDVTMEVAERFRRLVRADSRVLLRRLTVLGNAIIEIRAGSPDTALLSADAVLPVDESASIDELLQAVEGMAQVVNSVEPELVVEIVTNLKWITQYTRSMTDELSRGDSLLGAAINDAGMRERIETTMASLDQTLGLMNTRLEQLGPVMDGSGALTRDLGETVRQLPAIAEETGRVLGRLDQVLAASSEEMQQFPGLVTQVRLLMEKMDLVLDGLQRVWPLSGAIEQTGSKRLVPARPLND